MLTKNYKSHNISFVPLAFLGLFLTFFVFSYDSIEANNNHHGDGEQCGTQVYTFNRDGSNNRVEVDFESNQRQIDVLGKNGWSVIKVELEVEDDNHSGYWQYSTGPLNNFNPNPGGEIESVRVTLTKSCSTPSPTSVPTESPVPTQSATIEPSNSPTSTPSATPTDEQTPVPTSTPDNDLCQNIDGIQISIPEGKHLDNAGKNCLEFSVPGVSETNDPAVTIAQVLGASTMANTGVFEDTFFNSIFILGSFLTSFGIMKNGKRKVNN